MSVPAEFASLRPGPRRGTVAAPPSKSHAHRLLIANFLASRGARRAGRTPSAPFPRSASADIRATARCLAALATDDPRPVLDCGESGSTLRFLAPVAAALGKHPSYIRRGRLAERPFRDYATLVPGRHELAGDVSSQFVTGLLFALPLLTDDSEIAFTSPLESRGYVDLTRQVLAGAGIRVETAGDGFRVPGNQRYRSQPYAPEGDWSGAAFWLAMNALGSAVAVTGLNDASAQPDRAVVENLAAIRRGGATVDVSSCPDIFPVLSVVAAATPSETVFTGIARLRLKESDRVAAMADVLGRLGVPVAVTAASFRVTGTDRPFPAASFTSFGDHRIAMSVAVAATRAAGPLALDDTSCAAKSYPEFFSLFDAFDTLEE